MWKFFDMIKGIVITGRLTFISVEERGKKPWCQCLSIRAVQYLSAFVEPCS